MEIAVLRSSCACPNATVLRAVSALEQKAAANRQVIEVMRQRLAAGEQVARMHQEPGLAWLARQAEVMEDLVAERQVAHR